MRAVPSVPFVGGLSTLGYGGPALVPVSRRVHRCLPRAAFPTLSVGSNQRVSHHGELPSCRELMRVLPIVLPMVSCPLPAQRSPVGLFVAHQESQQSFDNGHRLLTC